MLLLAVSGSLCPPRAGPVPEQPLGFDAFIWDCRGSSLRSGFMWVF